MELVSGIGGSEMHLQQTITVPASTTLKITCYAGSSSSKTTVMKLSMSASNMANYVQNTITIDKSLSGTWNEQTWDYTTASSQTDLVLNFYAGGDGANTNAGLLDNVSVRVAP
jgi:hypothetical protein